MSTQELFQEDDVNVLKDKLIEVYKRRTSLECESFLKLIEKINVVLENEDEIIRPRDHQNLPGGIINLKQYTPTVIVPDLHARMDFFLSIMVTEDISGNSNLEKLASDQLQIVCVGDGFHAERRAAERWALAFEEYTNKYKKHKNIDEEMEESLGVMEMVMEVKSAYPQNFHFLKGNHENISNEYGGGNFPFRKFTYEGAMVVEYVNKFYGPEFLDAYYWFEKNLPVFAVGKNFLISHAEPKSFYKKEDITEYRDRPDVVEDLTWTDNGESVKGTVNRMLEYYIGNENGIKSLYFGGHRVITGLYNLRAGGKYVQIHNPDKFIIALIKPDKEIDLNEDIIEIENITDQCLDSSG
jgi:hypothetical protein